MRKVILVLAVSGLLFGLASSLLTTAMPFVALGTVLEKIADYFSGTGQGTANAEDPAAGVDTDRIYEALQNGFELTAEEEAALRIHQEDFAYMIGRIYSYNHAGERSRTITVEGEYTCYVEVPAEEADAVNGEGGNSDISEAGESEEEGVRTVTQEEVSYVTKEVEVSNAQYEGTVCYDFRLFYYYCIQAAIDRKSSDEVLRLVTPLDEDFNPIESREEDTDDTARYYITREDIDKIFTYSTVQYNYSFDVLRDENEAYSFYDCSVLPHTEESEPYEDGTVVYRIPQSVLLSGNGAWYSVENIYDDTKTVIEGTKATFDGAGLESTLKALNSYLVLENEKSSWEKLPGGKLFYQRLREYAATDAVLKEVHGLDIIIEGCLNGGFAVGNRGNASSIGEAAVNWALSVSCNGESTALAAWKYSQGNRASDGYVDCSSLVWRAYRECGLNWPDSLSEAPSTIGFYAYFKSHSGCVLVDRCRDYTHMPEGMAIGDVIMIPRYASGENDGWDMGGNNHIILYAGRNSSGADMIVHASSSAGHVHTQTLASYMSYLSCCGKWYSVFRPYAGLSVSACYEQTGFSAMDLLSGLNGLTEVQREKQAAEAFLYLALQDAKKSNIIPSVTAAQALLESGLGTVGYQSEIAKRGNNLFGMKRDLSLGTWTSTRWNGTWQTFETQEEVNGRLVTVKAPFRVYGCLTDSFTDHSDYLAQAKTEDMRLRYAGITGIRDYKKAVQIIINGGYATDSGYVDKLVNIIERYRLARFDAAYETAYMDMPSVLEKGSASKSDLKHGTGEVPWNRNWQFADKVTQTNIPPVTSYVPENYNGHTVFLNPGHGGGKGLESATPNDPYGKLTNQYSSSKGYTSGASFQYGNTQVSESAWTLDIAERVKEELYADGYAVVMARTSDSASGYPYPENAARSIFANNTADIHVSIHFNSCGPKAVGYYRPSTETAQHSSWKSYGEKAVRLGECIETAIAESIGLNVTEEISGTLTGYLYSTIPCVYIETADASQTEILMNKKQEIAHGYAEGIKRYFELNK